MRNFVKRHQFITGAFITAFLFTISYAPIIPKAWAACSRVTVWVDAQTLTHTALNGEYNNILDNFLSCLSPLTTNLDVNSKNLLNVANIDVETAIRDNNSVTLIAPTATGSAVNWLGIANAALSAGPTISTAGTDTDIDLNITPKGAGVIVANQPIKVTDAAGATPAAKTIFEDSIVKVWLDQTGTTTPTIGDDLNVSSITDTDVGARTVNFATAMSGTSYAVVVTPKNEVAPAEVAHLSTFATTSIVYILEKVDSLTTPTRIDIGATLIAIGNN